MDGILGQIFTITVSVTISFAISYLISFFLVKFNQKLVFALPIVLFATAAVFWLLGLIDDSWGALGYLLYGSFALIAAVGSALSSFVLYRKSKKKTSS